MSRTQIQQLTRRLHDAQLNATNEILDAASFESLPHETPDGFTVNEVLRMWTWHFSSHYRDLVLARGRLTNDNPHFHVPHHVREANEQFGRFIGELSCMTDEQLDHRVPGGRSVREIAEHVLETLETYFADQVREAKEEPRDS